MTNSRRKLGAAAMLTGLLAVSLFGLLREWRTGQVSEANPDTDCPARRVARGERLPLIIKAR